MIHLTIFTFLSRGETHQHADDKTFLTQAQFGENDDMDKLPAIHQSPHHQSETVTWKHDPYCDDPVYIYKL